MKEKGIVDKAMEIIILFVFVVLIIAYLVSDIIKWNKWEAAFVEERDDILERIETLEAKIVDLTKPAPRAKKTSNPKKKLVKKKKNAG